VRALFPNTAGAGGTDALDEALANALRRSLATVLVEQPRWVVHQPAVLDERARFQVALDNSEPALLALVALVRSFSGLAKDAGAIAALWMPTFRVQARDVLPHDDRNGVLAAIAAVQAILEVGPPSAQVERELASLHQRVGDSGAASALRGPDDGQSVLELADIAASSGDMARARELLLRAQTLFSRSGMLAGMAAVKRREAAIVDPEQRIPVLFEAIRLSRNANDSRGEVEGLEDLSRAYSESARLGPAVAALGRMAKLHRAAVEPLGEARALQLAGRLLCEGFGVDREPGAGMVLLLWAADIGGTQDPVLADLTRRYIEGFQFTLSDAEFAAIEGIFDRPRALVVSEVLARYELKHHTDMP